MNFLGIYKMRDPIEVSGDTITSSASTQPHKSDESLRLSGSENKISSRFLSSSSLAIPSIGSGSGGGGGGSQSVSSTIATDSNACNDDSLTPIQQRRMAKSFSIAPSIAQTTKGW